MRKTLFVLLLPAVASAEPRRFELGVAIGGHAFSTNTELGVADNMTEPGAESSGLLGLRAALPLARRIAVEAEAVAIPTKDDVLGDNATVYGLRAHARIDLLTGKFKPFVVAGVGLHTVRTESQQMDNDTDRAYHWGAGARYAITDKLDLRLDARHLIVPDRTKDGATSDYEVTAGITYRFGAKKPPPVVVYVEPPPPPPPAPEPPPPPPPAPVIEELAGIGFELDSAKIDIASAPILERAFVLLEDNPNLSIEISGHTSAEGNAERNLSLSLRRAEAVKTYLVGRGISDERIQTIGHGSDVPIADNATPEGRVKNRRIEFRILKSSDLP